MHEQLTRFAQFWGMIYAIVLFGIAVSYAAWPSNKQTFDRAARAPLDSEDDDVEHG
jgi:cytochrome c oxidase cbb3-type subunit IV